MSIWQRIAEAGAGPDYAARYAARFLQMAASGADVHGEAEFVTAEVPAPASVLDAGCGTGRVAIRLHELGYDVVGVDLDDSMLEQARLAAPELAWHLADLAEVELSRRFDVVLLAGNTLPLLEPGALRRVADRMAAHLAPGGRLIAGFGTDAEHLPAGCPVTDPDDVRWAFAEAGLVELASFSGWDRPVEDDPGYLVLVLGRREEKGTEGER